nr:shikimate dehydrogenase [Bacillota bacterium]
MGKYPKATQPTIYFIGVTTGKSSIMKVFPMWAKALGLKDAVIRGVDLKLHDEPSAYREIVAHIKEDPLSLGALVTTHKIDLFDACADLFDYLDYYASLMGEISCISKRDGQLRGHAKDPITSGLALESFLPENYWRQTGAEVLVMGAGGSSIAITSYLMKPEFGENRPSKIIVANRSTPRLEKMKKIHEKIDPAFPCEYHHTPEARQIDELVNRLKRGSLVINATGLGKDRPGSPITDAASFPQDGIAWDFNYRGDLLFLDQAKRQQREKNLRIEDGWVYFIHGWTQVIFEVFDLDVDINSPKFKELCRIAEEAANRKAAQR